MALLAITIWTLIIIGAFMLAPILGWIVLLSSLFLLFGGLDNA